jgi:hypothetical protein
MADIHVAKEKIVRILAGLKPRNTCRGLFRD